MGERDGARGHPRQGAAAVVQVQLVDGHPAGRLPGEQRVDALVVEAAENSSAAGSCRVAWCSRQR